MSFNIECYINTSEENRVDKEITLVTTLTGTLKNETSIINPSIIIEGDISDFNEINYIYIEAFRRYYYITDVKSIRTNILEISCRVDVLMSFKTEIRSNTAIIRRQENNWNLYLNDGVFKVYQNPKVLTKEFPSGFSSMEFILAIAGK